MSADPDDTDVNAPTGLTLAATNNEALFPDGNYIPRIRATYTASVSPAIIRNEIQAKKTADSVWDDWGPDLSEGAGFFISPVEDGVPHSVRVRAVNINEIPSPWVTATVTPDAAPAGFTDETDGLSATQNAGAPENGDVAITADNAVAYSNLEGANTTPTTYYAWYDIDATGMGGSNLCTVTLYTNDGAGSTTWTERDSRTHDNLDNLTDQVLDTGAVAMGVDFDLRIQLTYASAPGGSTATLTVHGEDNSQPGVEFRRFT